MLVTLTPKQGTSNGELQDNANQVEMGGGRSLKKHMTQNNVRHEYKQNKKLRNKPK